MAIFRAHFPSPPSSGRVFACVALPRLLRLVAADQPVVAHVGLVWPHEGQQGGVAHQPSLRSPVYQPSRQAAYKPRRCVQPPQSNRACHEARRGRPVCAVSRQRPAPGKLPRAASRAVGGQRWPAASPTGCPTYPRCHLCRLWVTFWSRTRRSYCSLLGPILSRSESA
jgi:hypothetical protein